ncbi:restriction endonuclease-like protein [Peribacillus huizhouensis]|uniref:DUF2357 domain-containing protein n=1 Tax=Peribacillus huizhouensis TaxID=1501239 RepID=A0ABR6CNH9_9BACI|nr:restriction endonuclease-like protein [Peribacillus huizhouensis]MBA9026484.1 hypothetical protein [Peribacillus huizhouensis]
MVSLPSGSREDVELVRIETHDLSLIIKGKPYHQRYEGLKQYRLMDFHDTMEFSIHGKGIQKIEVYDVNQQQLVDSRELRPIFFENGIYQVIIMPKNEVELTFYHEHPLLRQAISKVNVASQYMLMGNLQFQNEVGLSTFEIRSEKEKLLEVTLEIYPSKLDYKNDYKKLLEEVNDEIYNLAYHFIRKTYLGATIKLDGTPSMAEFYRLISKHFDQFLQAVKRIELQPHHLLQNSYVKVRGDQLSKLDSRGRAYLRKRPALFVEVEKGINVQNKTLMPTEGLRIKKELTNDTLENRFIKLMMSRLIHKLSDLLDRLLNQRRWMNEKPDSDLIEKINKMIKQLEIKQKSPFWKQIGMLDRSVYSLVLQMAPGYRDAYQIFLTVSKGLTLQGKLYQMSLKDVATLYEYWTFLKLGQILNKKYDLVSQDIIKVNREGLFVNLESNRTARRIFQHPITKEKIILTYQKYEGNLPTIPQKPDTMLSIEKKGRDYSFNYIFDAKYRIDYAQEGSYYQSRYKTPGPIEDDINTMHRYRDSIVIANNGPFERTAFGAYVLFPWFEEDIYQEHHFYKSIDKVNIGALPFLPNATNLVEQIIERLIESSPEEIQKEGILPKGTKEQWFSDLDEKVLVGLVSSNEDYLSFVQKGYYQIPINLLKKGWQDAKYIGLYVKNGIADVNGVNMYGTITDINFVQGHINGKNEEYVKFQVNHWNNLKQMIRPVNYGIASYIITSINILKDAKELPELFMKSKNEIVLWRMIRRISDKAKVTLNRKNIDEATNIDSYFIKNISIHIEKGTRNIVFNKLNQKIILNLNDLERQPSFVFKTLLKLLEE